MKNFLKVFASLVLVGVSMYAAYDMAKDNFQFFHNNIVFFGISFGWAAICLIAGVVYKKQTLWLSMFPLVGYWGAVVVTMISWSVQKFFS